MNNKKTILGVFAGLAVAAVAVVAMAHADTNLAVSCSGAVSGDQITWTATSTGGNAASYAYLWSGDGGIGNATGTSVIGTYGANGTYTSTIQVTDASSSVATSTCSAAVTSFPAATSTLNVILAVNDTAGGSAVPGNFNVTVTGANATPSSFAGSSSGSAVTVNASTSYSIGVSSIANYSLSQSGSCTGPLAAGATSTCTLTEAYVPPTSATGTLNVVTVVNNTAGGSAIASNFTDTVTGANASLASFPGNTSGAVVTVSAGATYAVGVSAGPSGYSTSVSGNCNGPISAGASGTCTITETSVPSTTTSTPPLPRAKQPLLSIGENGQFLARGMIVTSVASGSFQGTVWGITYTVNWSGNLFPEFYFRMGNGGSTVTDPTTQLQVGDEVGVSGKISSSSPMVVNANVVRDYSILTFRPGKREGQSDSPFYNGQGNGKNDDGSHGAMSASGTVSSSLDLNARLQQLLSQFQNLQNLFKGHGNGNGNGNENGNGNH